MRKSLILSIFAVLVILPAYNISAQENNGFAISPPSFEFTANPGDEIKNFIKIENLSSGNLQIKARVENFVAYGEGGQINLTEEDSTYSISKWVSFPQTEVTVEQGKSKSFEFILDIPLNTEPGSHYGAIVFSTVVSNTDPNSPSVIQEIGSIILIRVPGDVIEKGELSSFTTTESSYTTPNIKLNVLVENTGSVHFKHSGYIYIKDILGNTVTTLQLSGKNILPNSKRLLEAETSFENFGFFKAELELFYKNGEEVIRGETSFLALNTQKSIPIIIGILAATTVLIIFRKRIKKALKIILKGEL